jgi:hypothetical protein
MRTTLATSLLLSLFFATRASAEESRLIYSSALSCIDFYTKTGALRFTGGDRERLLRSVGFADALMKDRKAIKSVLKSKDGAAIRDFAWKLNTGQRLTPVGVGKAPELKAGDYTLEYLLSDKVLAKISLVVEAGDGGFYLDGPWNEWGYVSFKDASSPVLFHAWFRSKEAKGKKAIVKVELLKGKKVVATTTKDLFFNSQWGERNVNFDQGRFTGKDLLKDGAYQFRVTVGGALYGTYKLKVNGGKIVPIDEQDSSKTTDVASLMEGGGDQWYLKREK